MVLSRNKNLHTINSSTIKHLEILHISDVATVGMATTTIQDDEYYGLNAFYFKNRQVTHLIFILENTFYCTICYLTISKKVLFSQFFEKFINMVF